MRQAATVLLDSLRMLRASMLFWISIGISALVALVYASIGFTDQGISALFGLWDINTPLFQFGKEEAKMFYLSMFTNGIARFWLGWFSLPLALISTCSIFPNFLQVGSIELALSKPISRARLFLLKYMGGLLFVAVQTGIFCAIVFFALGFRFQEWNFTIFWAVPVITFSFSLIYCVSAFIGLTTRSSIFALLGSLLFWAVIWGVQFAEDVLYQKVYLRPEIGMMLDFETGQIRETAPDPGGFWKNIYEVIRPVSQVLPKSRETILSLKRLIRFSESDPIPVGEDLGIEFTGGPEDQRIKDAIARYENRHTNFSIFGTSLLFELLVMGATFGIFARRDY